MLRKKIIYFLLSISLFLNISNFAMRREESNVTLPKYSKKELQKKKTEDDLKKVQERLKELEYEKEAGLVSESEGIISPYIAHLIINNKTNGKWIIEHNEKPLKQINPGKSFSRVFHFTQYSNNLATFSVDLLNTKNKLFITLDVERQKEDFDQTATVTPIIHVHKIGETPPSLNQDSIKADNNYLITLNLLGDDLSSSKTTISIENPEIQAKLEEKQQEKQGILESIKRKGSSIIRRAPKK